MLKKLHGIVSRAYLKKIDATGLAVFRIFYSLVLFCEVLQLHYFRHLVFDPIPYLEPAELETGPVIILWMVVIAFITIGFQTRISVIVNYLFTVLFFGLCTRFEYHMFYVYTGVNFLMMFLPLSKVLSIDRLLLKLKYSNTRFTYNPPRTVSKLSYTIPLLVAVAFVYFDSIFFKSLSPMWRGGLGFWLPASMPIVTHTDGSIFLNSEIFSKALGYLTFIFEFIFLFTFWFKRFRVPLLIIGIGLHIGIVISFAIPWFGFGVTAIYMLLVPVSCWKRWKPVPVKNPRLYFYYDNECPLCMRTKISIEHIDVKKKIRFLSVQAHAAEQQAFKNISGEELLLNIYSVDGKGKIYKGFDTYIQVANAIWWLKPLSLLMRIPGIYHLGKSIYGFVARNRNTERCTEENCGYTPPAVPVEEDKIKILHRFTVADLKTWGITAGLILLVVFQLIISLDSAAPSKIFRKLSGSKGNIVHHFSSSVREFTKPFFGITNHGVFMDHHFINYNHLFAVVYLKPGGGEEWLPMTQPDGQPGWYNYGSEMVNWDFRVNNANVNQRKLLKGIRNYSAFWSQKHDISLDDASFKIMVKEIETPVKWERDFLHNQIMKPWREIGTATWKNEEFNCAIEPVEGL